MSTYDEEETEDTAGESPWARIVVVAFGSVAVAALLWLGGRAISDDGEDTTTLDAGAATSEALTDPPSEDVEPGSASTDSEAADDEQPSASEVVAPIATADDTTTTLTAIDSTTSSSDPASGTIDSGTRAEDGDDDSTAAATSSTVAEDDADATAPPVTIEIDEESDDAQSRVSSSGGSGRRRPAPEPRPYDTLPDGTPAPVTAVFGGDRITLSGEVPSAAARERLQALAVANSRPGQTALIVNFVTVNPAVPEGTGVRVVELTSERFPIGEAEIRPAHAAELDRVASVMTSLPRISLLVIAHSDRDEAGAPAYRLSDRRADAVVRYLIDQGISPDRVASRAVGARDLLTLNSGRAARELNRRTEFVFYGLLVDD